MLPNLKLKVLMSMLSMKFTDITSNQEDIKHIFKYAATDSDEWVQAVYEILKDFPTQNSLHSTLLEGTANSPSLFLDVLQRMEKDLPADGKAYSQEMPLEVLVPPYSRLGTIRLYSTLTPPLTIISLTPTISPRPRTAMRQSSNRCCQLLQNRISISR